MKITDSTGEMANVIIADIVADNGVIHVIGKLLLPGARPACNQSVSRKTHVTDENLTRFGRHYLLGQADVARNYFPR